MRSLRALITMSIATASVLAGAVAVAGEASATGPTPPYTAFSVDVSSSTAGTVGDFFYTGTQVTESGSPGGIQLSGTEKSPIAYPNANVAVTPRTGTTITANTTYQIGANTGQVGLLIDGVQGTCNITSGTVAVGQLTTMSNGNFTAFAADYHAVCDTGDTLSGSLRWNTTQTFTAVVPSVPGWFFGDQRVKTAAPAKTFTFSNTGTSAVQLGAPAITGAPAAFAISANTCSTTVPLAVGASCTVSVRPTAQLLGNLSGELDIPAAGLADRVVGLQVNGVSDAPIYVVPGAHQISMQWGSLPQILNAIPGGFEVWRGASPTSLAPYYFVGDTPNFGDAGTTPGVVYYYAVQQLYQDGEASDLTPSVAAEAWPTYGPGMYHALGNSVRLFANHMTSAGAPITLSMFGAHGVPSSGVSAVVLDLYAGNPSTTTNLYVYPYRTNRPAIPDMVLTPGQIRTDLVIAQLSPGGRLVIDNGTGSVPVTADLFGYISGNGLSPSYGSGGAFQIYDHPGTILDSAAQGLGPLPSGYYVNTPVNFPSMLTGHVTSLIVKVTAYGSRASGTVTGYQTNGNASGTAVLQYTPGQTVSNTAIINSGLFYDSNTGSLYPSVSFLNNGPSPVQLQVSILGFVDDNTLAYGQRYIPTAPVRLLTTTMGAGSITVNPGSNGNYWTFGFDAKIAAVGPTRSTSITLSAAGAGPGPKYGQLQVSPQQSMVDSTPVPTGVQSNEFVVSNYVGSVWVSVWSFGRFDAYPQPSGTCCTNALTPTAALGAAPSAVLGAARVAAFGHAAA
jgi:hypothetical protein